MLHSFPFCFRFDVDKPYEACFEINLTEKEVADLKRFVMKNPGLPFWAMDYDLPALFDRMVAAQNNAIISAINEARTSRGEALISSDDINWEDVPLFFEWPEVFITQ